MKVIEGGFGKQPCADLAAQLRTLADQVERGEVVDLIAMYADAGKTCHSFVWATSDWDALAMTAIAHQRALDRMRRYE